MALALAVCVLVQRGFPQYCTMVSDAAQKARIDSVMSRCAIESCGGLSLGKCLEKGPPFSLAERLANFACFLAVSDRDYARIVEELGKRDAGFHSTTVVTPDITLLPPAGDTRSPVVVAIYVNASCPRCKRTTVPLYRAVTTGALRGKAVLYAIPFSVLEGNIAYMAAHRCGKFWEYYQALAQAKGRIDEDVLMLTAGYLEIPPGKFKPLLFDSGLEDALKKNYERAKELGISSTPTIFINGKLYTSHKDPEWVADAIDYEYSRVMAAKKGTEQSRK